MQSVGERTGSQKILRVISILEILEAVFLIVLGIMGLMGSTLVAGADPSELAELTTETGMTQGDLGGMIAGAGVFMIVTALLSILIAIFGLRASNDINKIMPAWIFSILGLAANVVSFIMSIVNGTIGDNLVSTILGLALSAVTFWVCNNIKAEAGR